MNNIAAIFKKQAKDTLKNKTVLIQFIMFPVLTLIMKNVVKTGEMPENFFPLMFAPMYVGMAPVTAMAAAIAEEKEKNTLRVLLMSNVKPYEYFLGIGSQIWISCMLGSTVFCAACGCAPRTAAAFMAVMAAGIAASLLAGAAIGVACGSQLAAASVTVPVMLVFSFLPMLSTFNDSIAGISRFVYSEQVSIMLRHLDTQRPGAGNILIVAANLLVFAGLFIAAYRKRGLE